MAESHALAITGAVLFVLAIIAAVASVDAKPIARTRLLTTVMILLVLAGISEIAAAWWEALR